MRHRDAGRQQEVVGGGLTPSNTDNGKDFSFQRKLNFIGFAVQYSLGQEPRLPYFSAMNTLGNLIWFIFGGFIVALQYLLSSLVLMITIVGIPFGIQNLKFAQLALWPFGKEVVSKPESGGCLLLIMNIIWIIVGGLSIALTHVIFGIFFTITIIGIPFGRQHFKLAGLALTPFGKEIVDKED